MNPTTKEQFKQFVMNTILEVLKEDETLVKEMTTTGNVAGYNTPGAFTNNKKGNPKAAEASGYKLVNKEGEESDDKKEVLEEAVVGDPFWEERFLATWQKQIVC